MTAKVLKLQNVYLVARDVAAQTAFYEKILGLPLKFRDGDRWVQYDTGGTGFSLSCTEEALPAETGAVLVFEVDDLNGVDALVTHAGGKVASMRNMGTHGAVLSVCDPEGNIFQMFRRASRTG